MELSAGDLYDPLVTKRFQDLRLFSLPRSSMTSNAVLTKPVAENITITGQVKRVVLATTDLLKTTHVVSLLGVREASLQVGTRVTLSLLLLPCLLLFFRRLLSSSVLPQSGLVNFGFILSAVLWLLLIRHGGSIAILLAKLHTELAICVVTSTLLSHTRAAIFVADVVLSIVKSIRSSLVEVAVVVVLNLLLLLLLT